MAERPAVITIRNWERFQHYKKRNPPWIRLYRDLIDRPAYRALSDSAARLLVELWLLASEFEPGGTVPHDLMLLAWRTGRASTDTSIGSSLKELAAQGFIEVSTPASADASADASTSTPQRQRTETEYREQLGLRPDVENSGPDNLAERYREAERELLTPGELPPSNVLTITGVAALADRLLRTAEKGPREPERNLRLVRTWNGRGKSLEEIRAVVEGLAAMIRDGRPEVDWIEGPASLATLENTGTLYDQGDGKAQRPLWDVAYEYAQRMGAPPPDIKRGGGPRRLHIDMPKAS